jgi:hypothetical protein
LNTLHDHAAIVNVWPGGWRIDHDVRRRPRKRPVRGRNGRRERKPSCELSACVHAGRFVLKRGFAAPPDVVGGIL